MTASREWLESLRRFVASMIREDAETRPTVTATFGTVRSVGPVRVALDSDPATPLPVTACLAVPAAGERVWVHVVGRQVVVVGVVRAP